MAKRKKDSRRPPKRRPKPTRRRRKTSPGMSRAGYAPCFREGVEAAVRALREEFSRVPSGSRREGALRIAAAKIERAFFGEQLTHVAEHHLSAGRASSPWVSEEVNAAEHRLVESSPPADMATSGQGIMTRAAGQAPGAPSY